MDDPRWLTPAEDRAWRGYRRMRALLDLRLSRDLARAGGLSDADYDVLSALSEADGHRLRLRDLAGRTLWSTSRLSHHLTRMRRRGLVTREECADDGRGSVVVLAPAGLRAIEDAAPHHVASVRRHLIDHLTDAELATLDALTARVLAHLTDAGGEPSADDVPGGRRAR